MSKEQGKSGLVSRNIMINGRRTSVRLEPEMWNALSDIASRERCTMHELSTIIALCKRSRSSLTAAIRVFLMLYYKAATSEDGHVKAGHGDINRMKERARRLALTPAVNGNALMRVIPPNAERRVTA